MEWLSDQFSALWGPSNVKAPEKDDDAPTQDDSAKRDHPAEQDKEALQTSGDLSKEQILRFFAAARLVLESQEFRRKLKDAHFLKQDLEDFITNEQKRIFEEQGIGGDCGVQFLGKVNVTFKHDSEVMAQFLKLVSTEEDALAEAELPPESYEQNQRLMALAKGHAAELMEQLKALPPEEKRTFLANQMKALDNMRNNMNSANQAAGGTMTTEDKLKFFENARRR